MINYMDYLHVAAPVAVIVVVLMFLSEIIKASKIIVEFVAEKFFKIKTKAAKKREDAEKVVTMTIKNSEDLQTFMSTQRKFNDELKEQVNTIQKDVVELSGAVTDLQLESMRDTILDFASAIADPNNGRVYTKEQYNYVRKIYRLYTELIKEKNKTNDEVDLSMQIINERYDYNVLHKAFIEDLMHDREFQKEIRADIERRINEKENDTKKKTTTRKRSTTSKPKKDED